MEIRADYHFHPNLSKNDILAEQKCLKLWDRIQELDIKCILVTEHVYKNAKRAYQMMAKSCPKDFFCFPGIEYVTKEGIDIIVFSNGDNIYEIEKLNIPFALSYDELIDLVLANDNLHSFITHPFTLGATSIVKKLGEEMYFKYFNKIGSVEISNGSFINLLKLVNFFPLNFIFCNKIKWANNNFNLPEKYLSGKIQFLAVGSDAHIVEDIGLSALVDVESLNKEHLFDSLVNNKNKKVYYHDVSLNILSLCKNYFIVLEEFLIKLRIRLCGK